MTYPAYPEYKDSGIPWLGNVPEGWVEKKIKYCFTQLTEKNNATNSFRVALENILSNTGRFVETESDYSGDGISFSVGDILFGKLRPYLAKVFLSECEGDAFGDFFVLRHKQDVDPHYAWYQMLMSEFITDIDSSTFGTKMPRASWDYFCSRLFLVPPLFEQRAIAAFLDRETKKIDDLITEQQKLLELIAEKRQALISHVVTKGLNPDVFMKDSGIDWLGQIPAHWEVKQIKYVAWVRARLGWKGLKAEEYVDEGYAFLATPNIKNKNIDFENVNFITQERYDELPEIKLANGDVLLAKDGSTLGTVNYVRDLPFPTTVNSSIAVITPKHDLNTVFLYYLFQSTYLKTVVEVKKGVWVFHIFFKTI